MHNHSYENEFTLYVNEISFSYEKMGTKTRLEEEAKGNSEMAYFAAMFFRGLSFDHRLIVKVDARTRKPSLTTVNRND